MSAFEAVALLCVVQAVALGVCLGLLVATVRTSRTWQRAAEKWEGVAGSFERSYIDARARLAERQPRELNAFDYACLGEMRRKLEETGEP